MKRKTSRLGVYMVKRFMIVAFYNINTISNESEYSFFKSV